MWACHHHVSNFWCSSGSLILVGDFEASGRWMSICHFFRIFFVIVCFFFSCLAIETGLPSVNGSLRLVRESSALGFCSSAQSTEFLSQAPRSCLVTRGFGFTLNLITLVRGSSGTGISSASIDLENCEASQLLASLWRTILRFRLFRSKSYDHVLSYNFALCWGRASTLFDFLKLVNSFIFCLLSIGKRLFCKEV